MKKDMYNADYDAAEQEILSLLQKIQNDVHDEEDTADSVKEDLFVAVEVTDALPTAPATPDAALEDMPLILDFLEDEVPPASAKKAATKKKAAPQQAAAHQLVSSPSNNNGRTTSTVSIGKILRGLIPFKGEPVGEMVRKCVFLVSLIVFIGSLGFLGYYMVVEPQQVNSDNSYFASLYNDKAGNEDEDGNNYPAGMQASFRKLYDINKDVAGWLSYVSSDADTFLNIDLPVVHCDNNDKYLNHAFDGTKSRSGTLFFEASNTVTQGAADKVSIIYGHNMASGTMFAHLNKLIGNVYRARSATTITLNTLYDTRQYQVFAVLVCDEGAEEGKHFGYLRNSFADDTDFLNYVSELRARSLFDYPVEVSAEDELLILSTCTNKSQVKIADGRLAVVARRVRNGENVLIDTTRIVKNDDVIMPYAWYTAQDLTPHAFYTQTDYHIPEDSTVRTTDNTTTGATTQNTTDSTSGTTNMTTEVTSTAASTTSAATVTTTTDATTTTTVSTADGTTQTDTTGTTATAATTETTNTTEGT